MTEIEQDLTFEAALNELEKIVKTLEMGQIELDRSIEQYERAELLKKFCQDKLSKAEAKIEKITLANQAPVGVVDADI